MDQQNRIDITVTAKDLASPTLGKVGGGLSTFGSKLMSVAKVGIGTFVAGVGAMGTALIGLSKTGISEASQFESVAIGFKSLTGSAEEAQKIMNMIKEDAKKTPFEFKGLAEANRALTTVTGDAVRSEKMLLNVGKALAFSGKGQAEMDRIIYNLKQIGDVGAVTEMDIRQFGFAGIDVLGMLATYYGTTKDKAGDMLKKSKDGFADLEKAFAKAGGEGGKYFTAFEDNAGSFEQRVSNLKDTWSVFTSDFVTKMGIFDLAKGAISFLTERVGFFSSGIEWAKNKMIEFAGSIVNFVNTNPFIQHLINMFKNELVPAVQKLLKTWEGVWNDPITQSNLKMVATFIGGTLFVAIWAIIKAITIFVNVLDLMYKGWYKILNVIRDVIAKFNEFKTSFNDSKFGQAWNAFSETSKKFSLGGLVSNLFTGKATGMENVPHDMLVKVHKNERIVPANENKGGRGGSGNATIINNFYNSAVDVNSLSSRLMFQLRNG